MVARVASTSRHLSRLLAPAVVRGWTRAMLVALGRPRAEVSVTLTDDATIHALNLQYRKKDRPTDVLSFALEEGEHTAFAGGMLGDVVLSLETTARQARARRRSLEREAMWLLAHGLLHLVGYDHETDADERRMNAKARVLCRSARTGGGARIREKTAISA